MNTQIIAKLFPSPLFDFLISLYNKYQYVVRHSGTYKRIRDERRHYDKLSLDELKEIQQKRFLELIEHARCNSDFYREVIGDIELTSIDDLKQLPFLEKIDLVNRLLEITTIDESDAIVSYTGGTTGASMKVYYDKQSMQERFAYLDNFRAQYGYELGEKVAWFSGKNLLSDRDLNNNRYHKDDYINKVRFFSTFHITAESAQYYFASLQQFKPRFLVGFPSSVLRICKFAESQGLKYEGKIEVFFPTAEMVTQEHREVIGRVLGCQLVDQYASSEGAPFIFECSAGNLHIDITSGVFEVLDGDGNDAEQGELVVTSFSTHGTPLIRYRVGDRLVLSSKSACSCGSSFPIADKIEGRRDDFIVSPTHGEVNLGNLSNSTKGIAGIISFQIEQKELNAVTVRVVSSQEFDKGQRSLFESALAERLGDQVKITLLDVTEIPVEKSGKFRIIKNMLKAK